MEAGIAQWQTVRGQILEGHRVASGFNHDPRFPGGTLRMQIPFFLALGLDLRGLYPGTLNVNIAPCRYRVVKPRRTFRNVKWHPTEPAEDFSFFDVRVAPSKAPSVTGLIYYPHPETKPEHFQKPGVLELLLPFVKGLNYGAELDLEIPSSQMVIEFSAATPPANRP